MLRLRNSILTHLLSSSAASPIPFPLHRLISAAAPAVSPNPSFAVEDYLVETCGLTRPQALKASAKISHLKSPSKPDAVLGLSGADVAALVASDPKFLCTGVERTLTPIFVGLTGIGLSRTEIARLVLLVPLSFRNRSIVSNLPYCLSLFGSYENLLRVLNKCSNLLGSNLNKVVKPNVAVLWECGLGACDIAKLCRAVPWLLSSNPERVRAMVTCAEGLGVPRVSAMFTQMLHAVVFRSEEKIALHVEYLKSTISWSDAEVSIALSKAPSAVARSKESLHRRSDFLISEMGLEPAYIARRSALLTCSLEGRLRPRYYALKFLKGNRLVKRDPSYDAVVKLTDKAFQEKFICPHKEAAPHLAEDYATACTGQVPDRFRFA